MRIAICDDDKKMTSELETLIFSCFEQNPNHVECDVYFSGEELLAEISSSEDFYHIYLLDIEMKGISGLETAKHIRSRDENAVIIFITSHSELMQEAFEVSAFHYLIKPLDEEKAKRVILHALDAFNHKKAIIQFTIRKKVYTLFFEQIEYFESNKRKVTINLTNQKVYEYYGTLKEVIIKLPEFLFVQIHNSYIINMEYIQSLDGNEIEMRSGTKIALTQKFKRDFQISYRNYILMRTE